MGHPTTGYRWAWHAYTDGANVWRNFHNRTPSKWWGIFKGFRNAINRITHGHPDIWLTEQGVVFSNEGKRFAPGKNGHVARATMRAYVDDDENQLTRQSKQIQYFYYYETRGEAKSTGHQDSGLVPPAGSPSHRPRAIYYIYRHKTPH
jgi:hypothetical protein